MVKEKVTNIKDAKNTRMLTNGEINLFQLHPAVKKLIESKEMKNKVKLKIYRFVISITDSDEAKALNELVQEIVKKYKEEHPELDFSDPNLRFDDSIFEDIFEQDSGLEVELLKLRPDELPADITVQDMLMLKPFFTF